MTSLSTVIAVLLALLGIITPDENLKLHLQDPAVLQQLGVDTDKPTFDHDQLKQQYLIFKDDKDGGAVVDLLEG